MNSRSNLPEEIVEKIAEEHLDTYSQLISFSKVSKLWRFLAIRSQNPRAASASRRRRRICLPGLIVSKKTYPPYASTPTSYQCHPPCDFLPLSTMFKHDDNDDDDDYSDMEEDDSEDDDEENDDIDYDDEKDDMEEEDDEKDEIEEEDDKNYNREENDDREEDDSEEDDCQEDTSTATITTTSCEYPPSPPWWSPPGTRRERRSMYVRNRNEDDEFVELEKFHCVSAKDGWLVLIQPSDCKSQLKIYLLNPITGDSIHLPPLIRHYDFNWDVMIQRFILSSSPVDDPDCHLILLFCDRRTPQLAWCNVVQDAAWKWKFNGEDHLIFDSPVDAAYFGRKLYVINGRLSSDLRLYVLDLDHPITVPAPRLITITRPSSGAGFPSYCKDRYYVYLSELNGKLLLVTRRCYKGLSVIFNVYKLLSDQTGWEEVTDLEGHAMFLGTNQSFCIPSYSNGDGIRDSCIYFAFNVDHVQETCSSHRGYCGMFSIRDANLQVFKPFPLLSQHSNFHYVWFLLVPSWEHVLPNNKEDVVLRRKRESR